MRYKIFGHSGLRVSEYALGAGTFGTLWGYGSEPNEARRIFDLYAEKGGNFLDTADFYQLGKSKELEEVSAVSLGFPHNVVAREPARSRLLGGKLGELELPVTPVA